MKNVLNVTRISLRPIFMSLIILFNAFAINGTVTFASLNEGLQNGELNDGQPNLEQPTGNRNKTTNVDNGIDNSKTPMFENLYETYDDNNFNNDGLNNEGLFDSIKKHTPRILFDWEACGQEKNKNLPNDIKEALRNLLRKSEDYEKLENDMMETLSGLKKTNNKE